jgi:hypothetical protein
MTPGFCHQGHGETATAFSHPATPHLNESRKTLKRISDHKDRIQAHGQKYCKGAGATNS